MNTPLTRPDRVRINLDLRMKPRTRWILCLAMVLAATSLTGCVRRRMTIRSNPPGALVYVDDYEIGTTPISHNFTYYGTRKIRLVKDGYETLTVMQPMRSPWWQIPPIDFVTENILPGELTDNRTLTYQMAPQRIIPPDELRGRAEQLRSQMQPVNYLEPVAQPAVVQPNLQPMQPGQVAPTEMVPMQQGGNNSAPYQPGEWIPPGAVAPANPNTPPQQYYNNNQPYYNNNQPYTQPSQPVTQPYPYSYPQPTVQ